MFGLSLSKLLFTALLIVAVWKGWRLMTAIRDKISDPADYAKAPRKPRAAAPKEAETLYECPHCHTYVPNGTICRSKEHCVLKQG
jgi:hypothetical protein